MEQWEIFDFSPLDTLAGLQADLAKRPTDLAELLSARRDLRRPYALGLRGRSLLARPRSWRSPSKRFAAPSATCSRVHSSTWSGAQKSGRRSDGSITSVGTDFAQGRCCPAPEACRLRSCRFFDTRNLSRGSARGSTRGDVIFPKSSENAFNQNYTSFRRSV